MMTRYIDADALKELIDGGFDIDFDEVPETKKALLNMIDYQETADVRENIHAHWEKIYGDSRFMCSVCKGKENVPTIMGKPIVWDFCPNCGAIMDERSGDAEIH